MTLGRPTLAAVLGLQGVRAFRHRNYRLFFGGQLISLVGTWMTAVAQSWLVLQLTGSPFILGVVAAAQFLPVLILGLFGGFIADQIPKRRTMMATQAFAMGVSFTLFALSATHLIAVWHIIVLAVLMGIRNAIDMPTRQAFAVEMVGKEDVGNAVALNSAMFNGARVLGPAIAGLTIGAFNISIAFLVDALSFLAVLIGLALMDEHELRLPPRVPRPHSVGDVFANLAEGLRYVRSTERVLLAILVVGLVSTFGMNFSVVIPALARDVLHTDASGYGFLMAAAGIGSVVMALAIAFSGQVSPKVIVGGALVLGVFEVVLGLSRSYPVSLLAMILVGAGGIAMAAMANTTIQLAVPDGLRGRVMSVYTTIFAGSTPIGGLMAGTIASRFGTGTAIWSMGAACVVVAALAGTWVVRISRRPQPALPLPGDGRSAALGIVRPR